MKLPLYWVARRFRAQRADYYEYLSVLLVSLDGRRSLHDVFEADARRYGARSARGRLSEHWAERFRESGGDLAQTFADTLPGDDIALMRAAQLAGAGALGPALADVARTVRLLERARAGVVGALSGALVAAVVLIIVLLAVPLQTVPSLQSAFSSVPPELWGPRTRVLFGLAQLVSDFLPGLLALAAVLVFVVAASLPHYIGAGRTWLDAWLWWRVYRDFHGIRFLALLATLVAPRGNVATPLRDALLAQLPGASRWKAWHLNRMLERVDDGMVGAQTFQTGLLDAQTYWFLDDMLAIHGVGAGLVRTRERIEGRLLGQILRRALALRWAALGTVLTALLGLVFWHYAVVDELRRALQAAQSFG